MRLKVSPEYEALHENVGDAILGAVEREWIAAADAERLRQQIMDNINDTFTFEDYDDETYW